MSLKPQEIRGKYYDFFEKLKIETEGTCNTERPGIGSV